jgi:hypothetical protein
MIGFEIDPKPGPRDLVGIQVGAASRSLLRVRSGNATLDEVAITPWGGYAMNPYTIVSLNGIGQERWAIQPISFLTRSAAPAADAGAQRDDGKRPAPLHDARGRRRLRVARGIPRRRIIRAKRSISRYSRATRSR